MENVVYARGTTTGVEDALEMHDEATSGYLGSWWEEKRT